MAEFFDVAWYIDMLFPRGIFVPNGKFVAFVVSSEYISLHTADRHRPTYRHPSIA
jgi:hypothetical protein